jgi:hypothetical protein
MYIPPAVETLFNQLTFDVIGTGRRRYSARAIFERMRWHFEIDNGGNGDGYKINNNWSPELSRRFTRANPDYWNFFEQRPTNRKPEK